MAGSELEAVIVGEHRCREVAAVDGRVEMAPYACWRVAAGNLGRPGLAQLTSVAAAGRTPYREGVQELRWAHGPVAGCPLSRFPPHSAADFSGPVAVRRLRAAICRHCWQRGTRARSY